MIWKPSCVVLGGRSVCNVDRRLMGRYGYASDWQYFMSPVSDALNQIRACEMGTCKSTVLESGGWRHALKGVL